MSCPERSSSRSARAVASGPGKPAASALRDLFFLLQTWQHPVEIVLLYPHLRCQLGDGDAGLSLYERVRLERTRAAPFAPAGAAARGRAGRFPFGFGGDPSGGAVNRAAGSSRSTAAGGGGTRGRATH